MCLLSYKLIIFSVLRSQAFFKIFDTALNCVLVLLSVGRFDDVHIAVICDHFRQRESIDEVCGDHCFLLKTIPFLIL